MIAVSMLIGITGCRNTNDTTEAVIEKEASDEQKVENQNNTEDSLLPAVETDSEDSEDEIVNREECNKAYADVLKKIYDEHILPDGRTLEVDEFFGYIDENSFAVEDVDGDSINELIFIWGTDAMAGMAEYVFKYDVENKTIVTELMEFPGIQYYENGMATVGWSHNQGHGEMWPYNIYEYDAEVSEYKCVGYVESWNKEISETDFDGKAFPADIDTDNIGVVYRIKYGTEYKEEYYSQADYDAFYEKVIAKNKKLDIRYFEFRYGYIEMLGESKLNPVIKGKLIYPNEKSVDVRADSGSEKNDATSGGSDEYIDKLKDGVYHVNIKANDIFSEEDSRCSVFADIYLKETYDIVDMNTLAVGDGIECDGIVTEIESIENENGGIYINGGVDVGGLDFVALDKENCYVYKGFDDIATYRKYGMASLMLSKDCVITDKSNLEKPDGITVKADEFKDYVDNNNTYICVYNTVITVEAGEITEITIHFIP